MKLFSSTWNYQMYKIEMLFLRIITERFCSTKNATKNNKPYKYINKKKAQRQIFRT